MQTTAYKFQVIEASSEDKLSLIEFNQGQFIIVDNGAGIYYDPTTGSSQADRIKVSPGSGSTGEANADAIISSLATVARTGSYNDLSSKPFINLGTVNSTADYTQKVDAAIGEGVYIISSHLRNKFPDEDSYETSSEYDVFDQIFVSNLLGTDDGGYFIKATSQIRVSYWLDLSDNLVHVSVNSRSKPFTGGGESSWTTWSEEYDIVGNTSGIEFQLEQGKVIDIATGETVEGLEGEFNNPPTAQAVKDYIASLNLNSGGSNEGGVTSYNDLTNKPIINLGTVSTLTEYNSIVDELKEAGLYSIVYGNPTTASDNECHFIMVSNQKQHEPDDNGGTILATCCVVQRRLYSDGADSVNFGTGVPMKDECRFLSAESSYEWTSWSRITSGQDLEEGAVIDLSSGETAYEYACNRVKFPTAEAVKTYVDQKYEECTTTVPEIVQHYVDEAILNGEW